MFIPDPGSVFFSILIPDPDVVYIGQKNTGSRIQVRNSHCTPQGTSTLICHSNIFRWRGRAGVALTIIPYLYIESRPKHLFFHSYYWFFETFSTVSSIILSSPLINSFFCVTHLRPYPYSNYESGGPS
jgi:hypothetical protein